MSASQRDPTCPFCRPERMEHVLEQTEHFRLVADHAPLLEGHLLLVPKAHAACYGAVPAAHDAELADLKARVREFLRAHYRTPVFFEHGVFHQTVYHAHLHALPLGQGALAAATLAQLGGRPVRSQDEVRDWYAAQGHYFYLEVPEEAAHSGWIFPPDERAYRLTLNALRAGSAAQTEWQPVPLRRLHSAAPMRAVAQRWHESTLLGEGTDA